MSPPVLFDGLTRRAPEDVLIEGGMISAEGLAPLDMAEWRKTSPELKAARLKLKPEAEKAERVFVKKRLDELKCKGIDVDAAAIKRAITEKVLPLEWLLYPASGPDCITAGDILKDRERWDCERFADPFERDYGGGDKRIAIAYLMNGQPCIFSHAHGGTKYTFEGHGSWRDNVAPLFDEMPPEWRGNGKTKPSDDPLHNGHDQRGAPNSEDLADEDLADDGADYAEPDHDPRPAEDPAPAEDTAAGADGADHDPAEDPQEASNRPIIQVKGGSLSDNADDAEYVLHDADVPIYRQRGILVRPARCTLRDSKGFEVQIPAIAEVTAPMLRDELCRHAIWKKFDGRSNKWVKTNPPEDVAKTVLSRGGDGPHWRTLAAVSATPFIRRDASIFSAHGFDDMTGTYLIDPFRLPPMPAEPDKGDAVKALAVLEALLTEFPFVDVMENGKYADCKPAETASHSVALSGMLTPLARSAIAVAPVHVSRAPAAGTGKSYLWDIISAIVNGTTMPVMAAGRNEEETEKRLVSHVLAGNPSISIDNLNGTLGGDFISQLASQAIVCPRILGVSKSPPITNRFCVFATGNNIRVSSEMSRRSLLCRLDAKTEKTYERKFVGHPVNDVLKERGKYIAACLTILRAHALAGYPGIDGLDPFTGFDDWNRTVRGALVWLGRADTVLTVGSARGEDTEWGDQIEFVHLFGQVFGYGIGHAKTVAKMAASTRVLNNQDTPGRAAMREALYQFLRSRFGDYDGGVNTKKAGWWLLGFKDVVFEGVQLKSQPTKAGAEWYIQELPRSK